MAAMLDDQNQEPSYIYFLGSEPDFAMIKIGRSGKPMQRAKVIQPWSPVKLRIMAEIKCCPTYEGRLHDHFYNDHSHNEWFRRSDELMRVIEGAKAGKKPDEVIELEQRGILLKKIHNNYPSVGKSEYRSLRHKLSFSVSWTAQDEMTASERKHYDLADSFLKKWAENRDYDYDRPDWPQLEYVERVAGYLLPKYGKAAVNAREALTQTINGE